MGVGGWRHGVRTEQKVSLLMRIPITPPFGECKITHFAKLNSEIICICQFFDH